MNRHPLSDDSLSLDLYRNGKWIVFDFETTNKDKGSALNPENRVVMVAWKLRGGPVRHFYGNIMECREFWEAYESADYAIAFNAKFEAHWLYRLGIDPTEKLWADPMIAEKVRLGNRFAPLNLDDVSKRYGYQGKEVMIASMMESGICPSEMPKRRLIARARRDVKTTEQIWCKQLRGLTKEGKLQVVLTRCLLTPILSDIERTGMKLDRERVIAEYEEYTKQLREVEAELDAFTGGINMASSDQLAEFLYEKLRFPEQVDKRGRPKRNKPTKRWPDGKPKTDKTTMEWLETQARTEKQKQFIELRRKWGKLNAAVTKNLQFFRGVVEEREGGIFYGVFNQVNTQTHRLSSSGVPQVFELFPKKEKSVQFQNMPRVFKRLFTVRDPDYVMTEADGSQLEFRVAAFLGQDKIAIANIRDPDFDAHIQTACVMHDPQFDGDINRELYLDLLNKKRAGDKQVKEWRQAAKPDTFKPLYGGTQGDPLQERYYKWFQDHYAELYAEQERWVSEVLATGRLKTPWGLRFYWDFYINKHGIPMDRREHKSIVPSVFNYPVQSLATAEIIPIALVHLYHRVKAAGLRVRFVNTVHDSVVAEVHKEDLEKYILIVKKAFTDDVYRYLKRVYGMEFNVPLGCEIKYGTHWGEGEEVAFDVEPPEWKEAA